MKEPQAGARRVLVTGAGTGIGRATAEAIVAAGGRVVAVGRRLDKLRELERELPGRVIALSRDLSEPGQREGLLCRARDLLGGLDGFVHSAGMALHQPLGCIDEAALRSQLEINLIAPLRLGEDALEVMEDGGAMVFVSSTLALRPVLTSAVYSATKAGLLSLVRSLALAGVSRRIRANAVCPGVVDTDMVRALRLEPGEQAPPAREWRERVEQQLETLRRLHPLGRLGAPLDVAESILHLLTASWVTGAELVVDGGLLLRE